MSRTHVRCCLDAGTVIRLHCEVVQEYFVFPSQGVVGNIALKSIYVGYTDASFSTTAPHPTEYGYLGPLIKAQVPLC